MSKKCTFIWQLAFLVLLLAGGNAVAQTRPSGDTGTSASPLAIPPAPSETVYPDSGTPDGYLFNLRPLGKELGKTLADYGIYLNGRTLQQSISNTAGGLKRGTFYEGFNLFGIDLDMQRIAGIDGGSVHFYMNDLAGLPFQKYSGSLYAFNRAFALQDGARLNELSYEQILFGGLVDIRAGRIPVGTEFDTEKVYCEFLYGLCVLPAGLAFDKGYPAYLTASWGAVTKIKLPNHFYFNAGVYEDEPSLALIGHWGFPGSDWDPDKARGATFPLQIGYRTSFADEAYPRSFAIGGYVDTGDYADPIANSRGLNRLLNGGAARLDHGKSGIWLQAEQTVWRPDMTTTRNLAVFFGANIQTSGEANISNAVFGGFSFRGPFEGRPNDNLNFVAHVINLNPSYTDAVNTSLFLRGNRQGVSGTEAYIELNYGIAVAPGVSLKPNIAYIFNPDQVGFPTPVATDRRALFVGVALSGFIPETFGLPRHGG